MSYTVLYTLNLPVGVIIFGSVPGGLLHVSAAGGVPSRLVKSDLHIMSPKRFIRFFCLTGDVSYTSAKQIARKKPAFMQVHWI